MAKFATIDESSNDSGGSFASLDTNEQPAFDVETDQSDEQILEGVEANENLQKDFADIDRNQQVNVDLAREVLAVLNEMENPYYDTAGHYKYINWENQDISYKVLRRAGQMEVARLIKNKRRLDFVQYGQSPPVEGVIRGARLRFKNPYYEPKKEERMILRIWEQRLFEKFFYAANDPYPNFGKFIGNAYEDFFDCDDMTWEIRRDGIGRPHGLQLQDPIIYKPIVHDPRNTNFYAVDDEILQPYLENFENAIEGNISFKDLDKTEDYDYLLVYDGQLKAKVTRDIVRKHHFFTRSDFRKAQRGFSVCEQGISIVTWIRNALTMNASNFTNNRLPKGFIAFTGGGVGQLQLEKLKKVMFAHMQGLQPNRFPMVGMQGEKGDAKWVGIGGTSREMEYHLWFSLLASLWCQLSGTDPRELSLSPHADAVGKRSLFEESSDGIMKESKDMGARTFLKHLSDSLNVPDKHGVNLFQDVTKMDVELEFAGFEMEDKKAKQDITKMKLETDLSLNEILAGEDKEPYKLEFGGVNIYEVPAINNPIVAQALAAKNQQVIQEQQMEQQMAAQVGAEGGEQITDGDKKLIDKYRGKGADIDEELLNEIEDGNNED